MLFLTAFAGLFVLPSFIPDEAVAVEVVTPDELFVAERITPEEIRRLQAIAPAAGPVHASDPN